MSLYLDMWAAIKKLDLETIDRWIDELSPAMGKDINFYGLNVLDADLLHALKNSK